MHETHAQPRARGGPGRTELLGSAARVKERCLVIVSNLSLLVRPSMPERPHARQQRLHVKMLMHLVLFHTPRQQLFALICLFAQLSQYGLLDISGSARQLEPIGRFTLLIKLHSISHDKAAGRQPIAELAAPRKVEV